MPQSQVADRQTGARLIDEAFSEVERYEQHEEPPYLFAPGRREFVQTLGAGLVILAVVDPVPAQQRGRGQAPRREERLSERFHLGEDGIVTVFTSKVEVGQGSRTEIAQAAAEEFRLPIERVRLVMADTELCPDDGGTAGSRTTPATVPRVRNAAAAALEVLAGYAAAKMNAERTELKIEDGQFIVGDRKLTLGELAKDRELVEKLKAAPPSDVRLVPMEAWRVLGTRVAKVGGRDIVTGAHKYGSGHKFCNTGIDTE
jgi:isoquinoline 1-oxidoreductase